MMLVISIFSFLRWLFNSWMVSPQQSLHKWKECRLDNQLSSFLSSAKRGWCSVRYGFMTWQSATCEPTLKLSIPMHLERPTLITTWIINVTIKPLYLCTRVS
jgi:hypothetical protein